MGTERYRVGGLVVDAATGSVTRGERRIELPPKSFALLVSLLRRAPEVATRRDLVDEVWDGATISDQTLSQRVRLLREALGDAAGRPRLVASVRGWGYRLIAPVERLADGGAASETVAVLPFANLSGRAEDEPLCEGLAEAVIGSLTRIEGLRVIARTSSFAVGRRGADVTEAGRRLGAGTILEGSVQRAAGRVRVVAQLIDASTGGHRWSERYDREMRDVLELEDEIAETVSRRVGEGFSAARPRPRRAGVEPGVYEAYLDGRYHFARADPASLARARACLERAAAADPSFAPAFDALAELYWYLGFFGGAEPRTVFGQATWHAMRALELDPDLAETRALLAMLRKELDYNWAEVERENARARELNPRSPLVRLRGAISGLLPHGRLHEALEAVDDVLVSDPLSPVVRWWAGAMAMLARRPWRADQEGRAILALQQGTFLGHWLVGMAAEMQDDLDTALASLEQANGLAGGIPFTLGFLAYVRGRAGRRDGAREVLAALERARESAYVSPFASALGHIGLGETDEAFSWMDAAVEQRDPLVMPLKSYHFLDPLRKDPRLEALLAKMRLA